MTCSQSRSFSPVLDESQEFYWLDRRLCYVRKYAGENISEKAHGFYPDGKPMFKYPMYQRYFHGVCFDFHPDGQIRKLSFFDRGRLHGEVTIFDVKGQLIFREHFIQGVRHGLSQSWGASGKFIRQELFLRGQDVPAGLNRWIETTPIHARHVLGVKNSEIRRIFLRELGYERLLAGSPHCVLHQQGDQALVRIDLPGSEEPVVLVKVRCPSTGSFYVLRVPPEMRTVREAVAWTFDLGENEYLPVQET